MEQLEFECFGGNFNETQFPNSERARRERDGSSFTGSSSNKDKSSTLPPVPALDDHLFGDERALDLSADLENLMLRIVILLSFIPFFLSHFLQKRLNVQYTS